ncbi:DUF1015 family protein [Candidatus Woesearchaeota archaeon]|nr:DUF1015 family protein [Candidatus Woesearchaeota archaeon]
MPLEEMGLKVPDSILLPNEGIDMRLWAVIAPDQFKESKAYWDLVRKTVGISDSTLDLIYPEAFIGSKDEDEVINEINLHMKWCVQNLLFQKELGFVLIDRQTPKAGSRKGLLASIDLEEYGSGKQIRPTEGTIPERLALRRKIGRNAPLHIPHSIVLINDPRQSVIEPLFEMPNKQIYDFELMLGGGHITGYAVNAPPPISELERNILQITDPLLVGDGNHEIRERSDNWKRLKRQGAPLDHPARYALVEIVNVYDAGLNFQPINRVISGVGSEFLKSMEAFYRQRGFGFCRQGFSDQEDREKMAKRLREKGDHVIPFSSPDENYLKEMAVITGPNKPKLEVETLQSFLESQPELNVEYVHEAEPAIVYNLKKSQIAFFPPVMAKEDFFSLANNGLLPKKAFSIGGALEKRYCLEAQLVRK